jgi:ribosomal protein L11 methyltransferase
VFPDDPAVEPPPGTIVVALESEQVCGSGAHATTGLCLNAMMRHLSPTPPSSLLDVGCGSGILSIVAAKLGVLEVTAIDVDPGSVRITAQAAASNGVTSQVKAADVAVADLCETYQWVVANIDASTLITLSDALVARVTPGGHLLLNGITKVQEEEVQSAYRATGERTHRPPFELVERKTRGSWVSLLLASAHHTSGRSKHDRRRPQR